jgi:outer membrane lipoprotein SlyB
MKGDVISKFQSLSLLLVSALLAGCASQSGQVYTRSQTQRPQMVQAGTVEYVKPVRVEGTKSGVGAVAGAVVGGVVGNMVGEGKGRTLATVGGALGGAAAGHLAEEKITDYNALEITVRLDSGDTMAIVQRNDVMFFVGERVRVLTGGDGVVRVEK